MVKKHQKEASARPLANRHKSKRTSVISLGGYIPGRKSHRRIPDSRERRLHFLIDMRTLFQRVANLAQMKKFPPSIFD